MNPSNELDLAVSRWAKDNNCDRVTALREFTKTPRGQKVWTAYLSEGGTEEITMRSDANITGKHAGMLRRLNLKADKETGHGHVFDAVTSDEIGRVTKQQMMKCLEELQGDEPTGVVAGAESRHALISRVILDRFGGDNEQLAAAMSEAFDCDEQLNPLNAEHVAKVMREVTKANPELWRAQ
jgi:hypothetical protein